MRLRELLAREREKLGGTVPAEALAQRLIDLVRDGQVPLEALYPAVQGYVSKVERTLARGVEREVFSGPAQTRSPEASRPQDDPKVNPAEAAMRALLEESCYVPGHGLVPWGEMTAGLHELRATYLTRVRDNFTAGMTAVIRRHSYAAGLLAESGCADLNEYAEEYGELPSYLNGGEQEEVLA
jgi:hypothetical protein